MSVHLLEIGSPAYQKMLEEQFNFFQKRLNEMGVTSSADPLDDWVSVAQAMKLLNVKRTKLQELKNEGKVHFWQDKKNLQFSRKSIAEYKRKHSTLG